MHWYSWLSVTHLAFHWTSFVNPLHLSLLVSWFWWFRFFALWSASVNIIKHCLGTLKCIRLVCWLTSCQAPFHFHRWHSVPYHMSKITQAGLFSACTTASYVSHCHSRFWGKVLSFEVQVYCSRFDTFRRCPTTPSRERILLKFLVLKNRKM